MHDHCNEHGDPNDDTLWMEIESEPKKKKRRRS